jgi:hypothetical protein
MAIKKSKTLNNGLTGDYWKIILESYDRMSRIMEVHIALFKDRDASVGGKMHMGLVKVFKFPMTYEESRSEITTLCYTRVKEISRKETKGFFGKVDSAVYDPDIANGQDA